LALSSQKTFASVNPHDFTPKARKKTDRLQKRRKTEKVPRKGVLSQNSGDFHQNGPFLTKKKKKERRAHSRKRTPQRARVRAPPKAITEAVVEEAPSREKKKRDKRAPFHKKRKTG